MADRNGTVGGVLILPGGRPRSAASSRTWQLANQRMAWLAWSLRHTLSPQIVVRRVRYHLRGWNSPALDALRDAENALFRMRREAGARIWCWSATRWVPVSPSTSRRRTT